MREKILYHDSVDSLFCSIGILPLDRFMEYSLDADRCMHVSSVHVLASRRTWNGGWDRAFSQQLTHTFFIWKNMTRFLRFLGTPFWLSVMGQDWIPFARLLRQPGLGPVGPGIVSGSWVPTLSFLMPVSSNMTHPGDWYS